MASLANLPQTAQLLLSLFEAQLTKQGVKIPERVYVPPGALPVWDGEQLTVSLMGIGQGQPAAQEPQSFIPQAVNYYATFSVNLVRAITMISTEGFITGEIPTAAQMGADGAVLLADAAALIQATSAVHTAYTLTTPGEGFAMEGLMPIGPAGGLAGMRVLLSFSVN